MSDGLTSFLGNSDSSFNVRYMLISSSKVDSWSTWHALDGCLDRLKFPIHKKCFNIETTSCVELLDSLVCTKDGCHLPVGQVTCCSEADLTAVRNEEWNPVHEEQISCECDIFVEL